MKTKLFLSLFLIGLMFVVTSFIAVMQYEQIGIFDNVFFSISMPVFVSIGVGLALLAMLFAFSVIYYVRPLDKMLSGLQSYKDFGKNYSVEFGGDDQLKRLNDDVRGLVAENQQLKERIKNLKSGQKQ